jgi:enterochelin esterase-like enzyme
MIMVNTLGYGVPNPQASLASVMGEPEKQSGNFTSSVLDEVMPMVEKTYKASKDRNQHAIVGLSMGGAETFWIGLNHVDKFAYVAGFSSAFVMYPGAGGGRGSNAAGAGGRAGEPRRIGPEVFAKAFPSLDAKTAGELRLLYVACGLDDNLLTAKRQFKEFLKSKDIPFTDVETPGAHTWMVWRRNLTEVAPLLFRTRK